MIFRCAASRSREICCGSKVRQRNNAYQLEVTHSVVETLAWDLALQKTGSTSALVALVALM